MNQQLAFFPPPTRCKPASLERALDDMAARLTKERGYLVVRTGNFITGYWLEKGADPQSVFYPASETPNTRRVA